MPSRNVLATQRAKMLERVRNIDPELANKLSNIRIEWFSIKNSAKADEVDLYIYDEIMPQYLVDWFGGVSAEGLIAQLNDITASTINVRINSPGGSVFEAVAIYNSLVTHDATINVYVDALAASAASIVAMAGDKITMMVGSQMMIHDAMGLEMGNAKQLREYATFLDGQSNNIASVYANKAGGEIKDWRALMLAETWMFADEAVSLGLADAVYVKPKAADPEPDKEDDPEKTDPSEDPEKEEEDGKDTTDDDPEDVSDEELEALMHSRHRLSNRNFKYSGRNKAPNPQGGTDSGNWLNDLIDAMPGGK